MLWRMRAPLPRRAHLGFGFGRCLLAKLSGPHPRYGVCRVLQPLRPVGNHLRYRFGGMASSLPFDRHLTARFLGCGLPHLCYAHPFNRFWLVRATCSPRCCGAQFHSRFGRVNHSEDATSDRGQIEPEWPLSSARSVKPYLLPDDQAVNVRHDLDDFEDERRFAIFLPSALEHPVHVLPAPQEAQVGIPPLHEDLGRSDVHASGFDVPNLINAGRAPKPAGNASVDGGRQPAHRFFRLHRHSDLGVCQGRPRPCRASPSRQFYPGGAGRATDTVAP